MIITITSNLTEEQASILAKEKWYQDKIINVIDVTVVPNIVEETPNSQTPWEFLKSVYEQMIIEDSTKHYIEYDNRQSAEVKKAREDYLRNEVIASISSTII